jgi:predicted choloylglycine hydrolase
MPELAPVHARLVELAGDDDVAARMLTLWDPPHLPAGCSQAVVRGERPVLVRNYDYHPDLFEQVSYCSAFTGRRVVGTGDCLWGLLDGVNDAGLAVSMTLGGRRGSEEGFLISLIVRYLLEVCGSVEDVREVLPGLPVNAAYNVTALDRRGNHLTAFIAPGMAPEFSSLAVVTNHRGRTVEDPGYARWLRSVERQRVLEQALERDVDEQRLVAMFLSPPLFTTRYAESFGTLYTAVCRPTEGAVEYRWRGSSWRRGFDSPESTHTVTLAEQRAA